MTTYLAGPSLAAATGTRLDSAAKHIQQCRVSQDHMQELVTFDGHCDADELIRNKYRYCIHKDELVIGIAKSWGQTKRFQNSAYPRVLSNLGRLADKNPDDSYNDAIQMIIYMYHNAIDLHTREKFLKAFCSGVASDFEKTITPSSKNYFKRDTKNPEFYACKNMVQYIHDWVPVGYANTLGWAHAHNGDTMTSVHIGGLRTVQNGHFEIFCGDVIQWYWGFEQQCFDIHGKRKKLTVRDSTAFPLTFLNECPYDASDTWSNRDDATTRKRFYDRQYGQKNGTEKHVPLIKPYKPDDEFPRVYDWYRVFAVAISSARPFEAVDIRISRQAI